MAESSNLNHYSRVIGIDVHRDEFVCHAIAKENSGESSEEEKRFGTFSKNIKELCSWAKSWNPEIITMESTGVYWMSLAYELIDSGFSINVVNARHVKALRGHKTDSKDAAWLCTISFVSTTNSSFIPSKEFRDLRQIERYRLALVEDLQRQKNRRAKLLETSCLKLSSVFSDLSGKNATIAIKGIINQEPVEKIMSALNFRRIKADKERVRDALGGKLGEHPRKVLADIQEIIETLEAKIQEYTACMVDEVCKLCPVHFKHLLEVPGISKAGAATLLIELGGSVKDFPTVKKFASWLGLCPGNNESAGKRYSGRTRKGNKYARRSFIECSQASSKSKSSLGSKIRNYRARLGGKKGIMAGAHLLARLVYAIISKCEEYRDPQVDYEQLAVCKRAQRNIRKIAEATGVSITVHMNDTGEVIATTNPEIPYHDRPLNERQLISQLLPGVIA